VLEYMKTAQVSEEASLPDFFIPAHKINAQFRVKLQGVIQQHIDSAISSTVNLPREATAEQVGEIYMQAWKAGCKGITVYREGSREGILITEEEQNRKEKGAPLSTEQKAKEEWKRDHILTGKDHEDKHAQRIPIRYGKFDGTRYARYS
jgi:Ribonucleotide reductase, alpha subunit